MSLNSTIPFTSRLIWTRLCAKQCQHFWRLNPVCAVKACKSIFGDFSDVFIWKILFHFFMSQRKRKVLLTCSEHSLPSLQQTNVFFLADSWLWSKSAICERLCRHHWLPIHVMVYRRVPGRQKKKKWEHREERTDRRANEGGGGGENKASQKKKWSRVMWRGGNQSDGGKEVWIFQFYPAH